jgi:ABC-2 type transport system ATP-binding protein
MVVIENLTKKYKGSDTSAISNLNLNIAEGEIFGLLGPNGAGKTTLISMLCGLMRPTSGEIRIEGMDYRKNRSELQRIIGVVPQDNALYPTLTARENLTYFGSIQGLKGRTLQTKIDNLLEEMGLLRFAEKKILTFSGGMQRRINLMAGILHEPKLLFLDEPTVGIDVQSKFVIMKYLTKLNESGTSIVYTSHHMMEAEQFCSKVAIIDSGTILVQGAPLDLIASTENAMRLEDVYLHLTGIKLRDYA